MIRCAQVGSGRIARDQLNLEVSAPEAPGLEIGIPEIALLVLYVLALIGIYKQTRFKTTIRWITMLSSLFILGFWFSLPLTLSKLNTFLLGNSSGTLFPEPGETELRNLRGGTKPDRGHLFVCTDRTIYNGLRFYQEALVHLSVSHRRGRRHATLT